MPTQLRADEVGSYVISVDPSRLPASYQKLVDGKLRYPISFAPKLDSAAPKVVAPGQVVTLTGSKFGATQGRGYVHLSDGGTNWGAPGNAATFQVLSWSDTSIRFTAPKPSGANGQWSLTPNSSATIVVVNDEGLPSVPMSVQITTTPVISSLSASKAGPGDIIVVQGQYFGADRGTGYLHFADNGVNWGAPGNVAAFQIVSWSDTQIAFAVPNDDPSGWAITPGTNGTVAVTNSAGLTSGSKSLGLTTGVHWPISLDSGVTTIGSSGNGHMETSVTIDASGNLYGTTSTWDTSGLGPLTGFHGAVVVGLYDIKGNSLGVVSAGPYGVMGGQHRVDNFSKHLDQQTLDVLYKVGIVNFYDPQYSAPESILNWIAANESKISAVATIVGEIIKVVAG